MRSRGKTPNIHFIWEEFNEKHLWIRDFPSLWQLIGTSRFNVIQTETQSLCAPLLMDAALKGWIPSNPYQPTNRIPSESSTQNKFYLPVFAFTLVLNQNYYFELTRKMMIEKSSWVGWNGGEYWIARSKSRSSDGLLGKNRMSAPYILKIGKFEDSYRLHSKASTE